MIIVDFERKIKNHIKTHTKKFKKFDDIPYDLVDQVFHIYCENMKLKTIPFFPNLRSLICTDNNITYIHPYPKLELLFCGKNKIDTLPKLPHLVKLDCNNNPISQLSHTYSNLTHLLCDYTNFENIDTSKLPNLNWLSCNNTQINNIPSMENIISIECNNCQLNEFTGNFPNIKELYCDNNVIGLFTAKMPNITKISCRNNRITDIPFYEFLNYLKCNDNKIEIIKSYPNLELLKVVNNNLIQIEPLEKIEMLLCNKNVNLKELPFFPNIIGLECSETSISEILPYPKLEKLYCNTCKIESIPDLPNLKILECYQNKITEFIGSFPNLYDLICNNNLITVFTADMPNMILLDCWGNSIKYIPSYPKLKSLHCMENQLETISYYPEIQFLECGDNQIKEIPNLTKIIRLNCRNNLLTTLPNINTWRDLRYIYYDGNLIEYLPLHIQRTINRLQNEDINMVYNDPQNIHDTNIQKSIQKSIDLIIRDQPTIDLVKAISEVQAETGLSNEAKQIIKLSCSEADKLVVCDILYSELFVNIWSIIREHPERKGIIEVMNQEMMDSIGKCFVGRISRLVNCLNGFDPRVVIEIDIKDQIANILAAIQMKLENDNEYTTEKHKQLAIESLREREIDEDTINMWVSYIE